MILYQAKIILHFNLFPFIYFLSSDPVLALTSFLLLQLTLIIQSQWSFQTTDTCILM